MPTSLLMHRNPVRPSICERGNVQVRILNHQVAIERQLGRLAQRLHQLRPQSDVGDKMPVHHIHMNDGAAALRRPRNLLAQTREIRRQYRGC